MSQVLTPRVTKSLLLAALLVGPTLFSLAPAILGQAPVCVARVDEGAVTVTPSQWVDRGQTLRLRAFVNATAPQPGPSARVVFTIRDPNGNQVGNTLGDDVRPPEFGERDYSVPADAALGNWRIGVHLTSAGPPGGCVIDTTSATERHLWGFWVGDKPDLTPVVGSLSFVQHINATELSPEADRHTELMNDDAKLTRYPSVGASGGTPCSEEEPQDPAPGVYKSKGHFRLKVRNNGTADFDQPDLNSGPIAVRVRLLDNGVEVGTQEVDLQLAPNAESPDILIPPLYSLVNRAGVRAITIVLDPLNQVPETDEANNAFRSLAEPSGSSPDFFEIKAPDLVARVTSLTLNPADFRLGGTLVVENQGKAKAGASSPTSTDARDRLCYSRTGGGFVVRVYLDVVDAAHELLNTTVDNLPCGVSGLPGCTVDGNETDPINFETGRAIGAGNHTVIVVPDSIDIITDVNATNDRANATVNRPDTRAPVLQDVQRRAPVFRTGTPINISGLVIDDADFTLPQNVISIHFTYPDGSNQTFNAFNPPGGPTNQSGVLQNASDASRFVWWLNSTYAQEGAYTFVVRATDESSRSVQFPAPGQPPLGFNLTSFPKDLVRRSFEVCREGSPATGTASNPTDCVQGPANGTVPGRPFEGTNNNSIMRLRFDVPAGSTGLAQESHNASYKTVVITDVDGVVMGNFSVYPMCWNPSQNTTTDCPAVGAVPESCDPVPPLPNPPAVCYNYIYNLTLGGNNVVGNVVAGTGCGVAHSPNGTNFRFLAPGPYNATVWIGDSACAFKGHGHPTPPLFRFELWDNVTASIANATPAANANVNAGGAAAFSAHITDNHLVRAGYVRLTKGNLSTQVNMTLDPQGFGYNATSRNGTWRASVPTGFDQQVCEAGGYTWQVIARDANNTLSYSAPRTLNVVDELVPTVTQDRTAFDDPQATASSAFQAGANVTFYAEVEDAACFTVEGIVRNAQGLQVLNVSMPRVGTTGRVYRSAPVATGPGQALPEGTYTFLVRTLETGAGRSTDFLPRTFQVANNLPPAFVNRQPDDQGFGRPGPEGTVSVEVADDVQGVLRASIGVRIGVNSGANASQAITPTITDLDATGAGRRFRVGFQVPATVNHGDSVTVNVTAQDGTLGAPLNGSSQWTFRVDGLAPRSTLTCTPSFPEGCTGEGRAPAVRGDTLFTLRADDQDPDNRARAGVASLRYTVSGAGQPGTTQTVLLDNTTFTLGAAGLQDGALSVRYQAVDRAGNEEPQRTLTVQLDTAGPQVQNVVATTTSQGANVTATIADVASDVGGATLFFRTSLSSYSEVPMTRLQGTQFWFGALSGARRGQQLCYYIEAEDLLGNVATNGTAASPACFTSENHPPQLTVTSPREGEQVDAGLTVSWTVSDVDNDPVTVAISYRRQGDTQLTNVGLTTEEQGRRSKSIDTTQLVAGTYALRIDATDTQAFNNRTTRILNVTLGGGNLSTRPQFDPPTLAAGGEVKVRIEITRAVDTIEARLLRGGQVVATEPMDQDPPGSRFWVATFRVSEPGVYTVEVVGEYADGQPFRILGASSLTVQGGPALGFETIGMLVLAAGVVALAVLGLRRGGA